MKSKILMTKLMKTYKIKLKKYKKLSMKIRLYSTQGIKLVKDGVQYLELNKKI